MKSNQINQEIGELLSEVIESGFSVNLFKLWKSGIGIQESGLTVDGEELKPVSNPGPMFYCAIQSETLRDTPELNQRCLKGEDLPEVLRKTVNVVRYILKKPSLEKEVEMMIAETEHHSTVLIQGGPNAACVCGKCIPLIIDRKIRFQIPWDGFSPARVLHEDLKKYQCFAPLPDEIATCPNCGKAYTFAAP